MKLEAIRTAIEHAVSVAMQQVKVPGISGAELNEIPLLIPNNYEPLPLSLKTGSLPKLEFLQQWHSSYAYRMATCWNRFNALSLR